MATFRYVACGKCGFAFTDIFGTVDRRPDPLGLDPYFECPKCSSKLLRQPEEVQSQWSRIIGQIVGWSVGLCAAGGLWAFSGLDAGAIFWRAALAAVVSSGFGAVIGGHWVSYVYQIRNYDVLMQAGVLSFSTRAFSTGLMGLLLWPIGMFAIVSGILGLKKDNDKVEAVAGIVLGTIEVVATMAVIAWGISTWYDGRWWSWSDFENLFHRSYEALKSNDWWKNI